MDLSTASTSGIASSREMHPSNTSAQGSQSLARDSADETDTGQLSAQEEPLDMSVSVASAGPMDSETLLVQQEAYRDQQVSGLTPELLRQHQQAMREFFPEVQPLAEVDSIPVSSEQPLSVESEPLYSDSVLIANQQAFRSELEQQNLSSRLVSRKSPSSSKEDESPQAKLSRSSSSTLLLHPSLRHLNSHDLAVALLRQDKREVALNLKQECIENLQVENGRQPLSRTLWCLLELLLNVNTPVTRHALEWLHYLVAAGDDPQQFVEAVTRYDVRTSCGIVWTANFLAHRCNSCCISP
ncbi:uncharacterized protein LOC125178823, partial [Hyalella azteca]|uniref:Uncharacterized protein LOC125178823 n=1 Tax=Hyalella azteca TaxID=294128 RepID=A0A979FSP8_HYAAZ